jgi:GR25 family glycosyltransferase involved in LPS biosynthesis
VKESLPKDPLFQSMTTEQLAQKLPIWVISLKRLPERRASVISSLKEAGIANYELIDAVDGKDPSAVTYADAEKYMKGLLLRMWYKGHPWARIRLAGDLSHYRLLERAAATNTSAIIMEDDVKLVPPSNNWYGDLLAALKDLPSGWDALYLTGCFLQQGRTIGKHLVALRGGACTSAYLITPKFARTALGFAQNHERQYEVADIKFEVLMRWQKIQAYACDPFLVFPSGAPTEIPINEPYEPYFSWWDRLWIHWHSDRKLI